MTTTLQNAIQSTMSPLNLGTIIRIWRNHSSRGRDYVIVGLQDGVAHLVKSTCINQDGKLHGSTTKVHKTVPYSSTKGSSFITVSNVTSIMGAVKHLDPDDIQTRLGLKTSAKNFSKFEMYASCGIDRRDSVIY